MLGIQEENEEDDEEYERPSMRLNRTLVDERKRDYRLSR